jgi:hypothetical protein
MAAITELRALLKEMRATLHPGTYVFCTWKDDSPPPFPVIGTFREAEGLTLILDEARALAEGLPVSYRAAWITLQVHSDLHAVGFLAEVTRVLAAAGIACNVVSAVNHDHLFVPADRSADAVRVLEQLEARSI